MDSGQSCSKYINYVTSWVVLTHAGFTHLKWTVLDRDVSGNMKKLIWGCQNWYLVTCTNFDPLKPISNGLLSQKAHTTCFPIRHIPKQCVFGSAVTPFYHTSIFWRILYMLNSKRVYTFPSKNTLFKWSICVCWTINNKFFNVIFILKHPGIIFTHSYPDILNLRIHPILSKSVSPTLKDAFDWVVCHEMSMMWLLTRYHNQLHN